MTLVFNDSRDWAPTVSVGILFHNLIPDGEKSRFWTSTLQYGTRYLWLCPLVRDAPTGWRIVEAGISTRWLTICTSRHLSLSSASVEIFPAKMFKQARYTACSSVIACYKFCCSTLHNFNLIDIWLYECPRCLMHSLAGGAQVFVTCSFNIRWERWEIPSKECCCVISCLREGVDVMIPR